MKSELPGEIGIWRNGMQVMGRYLVMVALLAVACLEGYYIFVLSDTIQRQAEDLRNISTQLQLLKSERETLNEEIFSAKKRAGEEDHGTAFQR